MVKALDVTIFSLNIFLCCEKTLWLCCKNVLMLGQILFTLRIQCQNHSINARFSDLYKASVCFRKEFFFVEGFVCCISLSV